MANSAAHLQSAGSFAASLLAQFKPQDRSLPVLLRRQAERYGSRRLFVAGDVILTYEGACELAARTAAALSAAGIRPGDRVALMCGNRAEFMAAYLGSAWLGAITVPINTASRGAQLEHILRNCGARLIVVEAELTPALVPLAGLGLPLTEAWLIGGGAPVDLPHLAVRPMPSGNEQCEPHDTRPGDTVAILYTSGTTGPSKGVCCPQAQYFWWGVHTAMLLGVREGDVLMTCLPLFHTNALNSFYQALLTGSTLVVEKRFSASGFVAALKRHQATVTYLLGAMVPILLSREPSPDDSDHQTRIALAPGVPAQFHRPFTERFGFGLIDGYGSTETNFTIGTTLDRQRPGHMGWVRPGFAARVVDDEDNEVLDGQPGELILRADEPFAFATGYFEMPDKTVEAWRNLWFHTGDRVVREPDGSFRFLDRLKDAIRRRGENISSFEVEQVVVSHPAVANAAVFPVRSELAEDEVMVAVVLREDVTLGPEALLDYCAPRMPYFAVPRFVEFVPELPATENGKIQKFKLRERGITAATWDREAAGYKVAR
ncbi:ATP-dependent acyl-CoA ligase [Microvirga yunnanensis]|uniref:ATP-dependent acyl-CoA ligase n=1 Tax=Microvirga yunnanensis TaxID=2953740 RepID=UPI0021C60195|nr:ATP-dependent acyl-CoA ligase [Microvirga sp. HBU65207]